VVTPVSGSTSTANVTAVGEARLRHGLVARRRERALQVRRQVGALECGARDLEQTDGMIGALDGEAAVLERDIGGGSFQKLLGDACSPGNDVVGRFLDHDRAEPHAAA